jgi:hypothetical protein
MSEVPGKYCNNRGVNDDFVSSYFHLPVNFVFGSSGNNYGAVGGLIGANCLDLFVQVIY